MPNRIDVLAELFEIRTRGAVAAAFSHASLEPNEPQWELLRGEREMTMRDIGEMGYATGVEFELSLTVSGPTETEEEQ